MDAPDSHWLQVKREWVPIEALLTQLAIVGDNAQEKIDSLAGQLDAQSIRDLHFLRMQRNRVMHDNKALGDPARWSLAAQRVRRRLEALQRARLAKRSQTAPAQPVSPTANNMDAKSAHAFPVAGEGRNALLGKLVTCMIWCAGSWLLQPLLQHTFTLVNMYSVAWWLLGLGWLLCWPGIAVVYLAVGLFNVAWWLVAGVFGMVTWLLGYIIANPY